MDQAEVVVPRAEAIKVVAIARVAGPVVSDKEVDKEGDKEGDKDLDKVVDKVINLVVVNYLTATIMVLLSMVPAMRAGSRPSTKKAELQILPSTSPIQRIVSFRHRSMIESRTLS